MSWNEFGEGVSYGSLNNKKMIKLSGKLMCQSLEFGIQYDG